MTDTRQLLEDAALRPMSSAPKDGTEFIAMFDGLPYRCQYDQHGRFVRMAHTNRRGIGRSTTTREIDGESVVVVLSEGEDDKYEVGRILWSRGFNFEPSGWIPFPGSPTRAAAAIGERMRLTP